MGFNEETHDMGELALDELHVEIVVKDEFIEDVDDE